jgi:quercetin dioxygenase-like cupin family protein
MQRGKNMNEQEQQWIKRLTEEGYTHVHICRNSPNTKFDEHTHKEHTVHVLSQGEMTLVEHDRTTTLHEGARLEIPPGTTHTVQCGPKGCAFIVGVKKDGLNKA